MSFTFWNIELKFSEIIYVKYKNLAVKTNKNYLKIYFQNNIINKFFKIIL